MEYQNARHILPPELIERIQQYFQGGYLYIPASGPAKSASHQTAYQTELEKRNGRIYQKYLRGWSSRRLAEHYSLSVSSIRRILQNQRKDAQAMEKSIIQVLRFWGLEELGILQREENVWEIDGKYMPQVNASAIAPEAQKVSETNKTQFMEIVTLETAKDKNGSNPFYGGELLMNNDSKHNEEPKKELKSIFA